MTIQMAIHTANIGQHRFSPGPQTKIIFYKFPLALNASTIEVEEWNVRRFLRTMVTEVAKQGIHHPSRIHYDEKQRKHEPFET